MTSNSILMFLARFILILNLFGVIVIQIRLVLYYNQILLLLIMLNLYEFKIKHIKNSTFHLIPLLNDTIEGFLTWHLHPTYSINFFFDLSFLVISSLNLSSFRLYRHKAFKQLFIKHQSLKWMHYLRILLQKCYVTLL